MDKIICHFDGSANPNPGETGLGVVFVDTTGAEVLVASGNGGFGTNNAAEYKALIWAMELALDAGFTNVHFFGDSQLVVRQVMGEWEVKSDDLRKFHDKAQRIGSSFDWLKIEWIKRQFNARAEQLSKEGVNLTRPLVYRAGKDISTGNDFKAEQSSGEIRQQSLFSDDAPPLAHDEVQKVDSGIDQNGTEKRKVTVKGLKGNKVAFIYSREVVVFDLRNNHCSCNQFITTSTCEHSEAIKKMKKAG